MFRWLRYCQPDESALQAEDREDVLTVRGAVDCAAREEVRRGPGAGSDADRDGAEPLCGPDCRAHSNWYHALGAATALRTLAEAASELLPEQEVPTAIRGPVRAG